MVVDRGNGQSEDVPSGQDMDSAFACAKAVDATVQVANARSAAHDFFTCMR